MLFSRIVRVGALFAALAVAGWLLGQSQPSSKQYAVLVKRGPKWVAGKPAGEQALGNHGRYLQEQMTKGALTHLITMEGGSHGSVRAATVQTCKASLASRRFRPCILFTN